MPSALTLLAGLIVSIIFLTTLLTLLVCKKWPLWSRFRVCLCAVSPIPIASFFFAFGTAALYLPPSVSEPDYGPQMFVGLVLIGVIVPVVWLIIAPIFAMLSFEFLHRQ